MKTMHPVVTLGSHYWDAEALPVDVYEERLSALRQKMSVNGWDGVIVHGDAEQSPMLAWLTNFSPRLRWTLCLVGPEGEPRLLVAGATRDLPAARQLTWVKSVESYDSLDLLSGWAQELKGVDAAKPLKPLRIAVYGMSRMRGAVRKTVAETLGPDVELYDAEAILDDLMHPKRKFELKVIRQAHVILAAAIQQLHQAWCEGKPICEAVLQAELCARRAQAHDVRILFSVDGGVTLRPFEDIDSIRSETLVCYVAVRYLGYWAERFVTRGSAATPMHQAAVDILMSLTKVAAPGVTGAALFAEAVPHLGGLRWHPMLEDRCGHGIGLALDERLQLAPDSNDAMRVGGVYSLQAGLIDSEDGGQGVLLSSTIYLPLDGTPPVCLDA
jgi:Xaa-Pro aminopeptidase